MIGPDQIRAQIESAWRSPRADGLSLAAEFSDAFTAATAVTEGLLVIEDLRPSELEAYERMRSAACTQVHHAAEAMLLDALATKMARFIAEHPDAPRR